MSQQPATLKGYPRQPPNTTGIGNIVEGALFVDAIRAIMSAIAQDDLENHPIYPYFIGKVTELEQRIIALENSQQEVR